MKPNLPFSTVIIYIAAIAIMLVCVSFIFKNTSTINKIIPFGENYEFAMLEQPLANLTEFEVKAIDLNKLSVSFYYNQDHALFIKIYDVIGNLVHQEKVTTKGKFRKEYNLTGPKTEVYIVEVGNENGSTTKRVFMI